jgi:hypothetical protein
VRYTFPPHWRCARQHSRALLATQVRPFAPARSTVGCAGGDPPLGGHGVSVCGTVSSHLLVNVPPTSICRLVGFLAPVASRTSPPAPSRKLPPLLAGAVHSTSSPSDTVLKSLRATAPRSCSNAVCFGPRRRFGLAPSAIRRRPHPHRRLPKRLLGPHLRLLLSSAGASRAAALYGSAAGVLSAACSRRTRSSSARDPSSSPPAPASLTGDAGDAGDASPAAGRSRTWRQGGRDGPCHPVYAIAGGGCRRRRCDHRQRA